MIYTVECFEEDPVGNGFHDALFFEDSPTRCGEQNRHLAGSLPIEDLNQFVSKCESDGFVVLRRYVCEDSYNNQLARTLAARNYVQSQVTESILIVSNVLQRELESISLCSPYEETDSVKYAQRRCVMKAPYKWLYHHIARLNSLVQGRGDPTAGQIRNLLGHIQARHGIFYRELDLAITSGSIRNNLLKWMYQPNEMILYVEKGIETVYVLRKWPYIGYDGNLKLDCWNWAYDGFWLQRKSTTITLTIPPGTVTVRDLPALPLRFTTLERQQGLIERGKGFWKRRYKTLAAYSGWDFRSEQYYVRLSSTLSHCLNTQSNYYRMTLRRDALSIIELTGNYIPPLIPILNSNLCPSIPGLKRLLMTRASATRTSHYSHLKYKALS